MFTSKKDAQLFRKLFRTFLLLAFSVGFSNGVLAYAAMHPDTISTLELARENYRQAVELHQNNQFGPADEYFLQAQHYYQNLPDWNMVVHCAILRSQINYDLGRLDTLEQVLTRAQIIMDREDLKGENFKQERIYYFQGLFYEATAQYQSASDFLDRAVDILQAVESPIALDSSFMSSHMTLSGSIFYDRRDFATAIGHYQAALSLFPLSRPDQKKLLNINNNIGLAYIEQGQAEKGMVYLEKSLAILPLLDRETDYDHYLQTYFNLVKGNLLLQHTDEAIGYLNQAKSFLPRRPNDRHFWFSLWAQVYEQKKEWEAALQNNQAALEARKEIRGAQHPSIAKLYHSIGKIALHLHRDSDALTAFQNGLQVLDRNFKVSDRFSIPSLNNISDLYLLIQLLKDKGDLLRRQHPHAAADILPTYRVAIQAIDSLRLLYESDASKLLLSKEGKAVFAGAIELLHHLYRQDHRAEYLNEAFQYMEKSKSLLLLENIRKWRNIRISHSDQYANLNFNALLEKEKNAKLDLVLLQRTIDDGRESKVKMDPAKLANLEKALRTVNATYEAVKTELSLNFPQYFRASYDHEVASVAHIQKQLLKNKETALISYFVFADQSFVMLIRKDSAFLEALPGPEHWQADFSDYQKSLRVSGDLLMHPENYEMYLTSASNLYDQLIRPLEKHLTTGYRRLYLVPDDILGFLAFESLLPTLPLDTKANYTLSHLDYLIEHYALAYGYSATLLAESLQTKKSDKRADYAGFAPVFKGSLSGRAVSRDCTTGNLMYLPYSEQSVTETSALYHGDAFLHEAASLANFRSQAKNYRILQLATHACVDAQDALFNVIYFHDTTLATYEIFDIPLNADLVILSACETGNGDLLQGEGIMSLSRGFYYAGSSNIVTSLWPADDHGTKELMRRFNHHLKKGLPKDEALRHAKLDYLNNTNLRPINYAPAIWANFILIGNQEKIELQQSAWARWALYGLLGLGLFIFAYLRTKKTPR